jgi:hypothetical protein
VNGHPPGNDRGTLNNFTLGAPSVSKANGGGAIEVVVPPAEYSVIGSGLCPRVRGIP